MAKPTPGLRKRGQYWHVEKIVAGQRLYESTGETELEQAERYLAKRIREIRHVAVYGERVPRTFDQAAARYVEEYSHKRSLDRDIATLKVVMPYIGNLMLEQVHGGTLEGFLRDRKAAGIRAGTLTRDLAIVRRVLNLSARAWRDEQGRPWLETAPPLMPVVEGKARKPRPITQDEQVRLLQALPGYLAEMAEFALHTGLRDQELCGLRWEDEWRIHGLDASVFVIREEAAKNGRERIVPLNVVARRIIESRRRAKGGAYVFIRPDSTKRLARMMGKAWRKAREEAGLSDVRVHDLRHTFGMRLRAEDVGLEDRQDLLGHHAGRITTHYSRVQIARLIVCVERLCEGTKGPELTLIRCA